MWSGTISAALSLRHEHDLLPGQIASVRVETTARGADILSDPSKYQPDTRETADHSLPYVLAVALAHGNVLPAAFEEDALHDPVVRAILPKIKVNADPEIDALFPHIKRARVTINTTDGQSFQKQTDIAKGDPQDPLTDRELYEKFRANTRQRLTSRQADQIIERTMKLETLSMLEDYMGLLVIP
jgi:2-methylcitrate dehydratase